MKENSEDVGRIVKRVPTPWYLGVLAVAGIVAGSFFYAREQWKMQEEWESYKALSESVEPMDYETFLLRYPDSDYADDVHCALEDLRKERQEWQETADKGKRSDFVVYMKTHPHSPYHQLCREKIDSLDWLAACEADTPEAYEMYLHAHPDGKYAERANRRK